MVKYLLYKHPHREYYGSLFKYLGKQDVLSLKTNRIHCLDGTLEEVLASEYFEIISTKEKELLEIFYE